MSCRFHINYRQLVKYQLFPFKHLCPILKNDARNVFARHSNCATAKIHIEISRLLFWNDLAHPAGILERERHTLSDLFISHSASPTCFLQYLAAFSGVLGTNVRFLARENKMTATWAQLVNSTFSKRKLLPGAPFLSCFLFSKTTTLILGYKTEFITLYFYTFFGLTG